MWLPYSTVEDAIDSVTLIRTRRDLNRWGKRNSSRIHRWSSLLFAYLAGALPSYLCIFAWLMFTLSSNASTATYNAWLQTSYWLAAIPAFGVFGPIVLGAWWWVLVRGLNSYKRSLQQLNESGRVCKVCMVVSLFEGEYVNPKAEESYEVKDLKPHMNVIKENGKTHVLCDVCLAELDRVGHDQ